jgi:hypothetical protein
LLTSQRSHGSHQLSDPAPDHRRRYLARDDGSLLELKGVRPSGSGTPAFPPTSRNL